MPLLETKGAASAQGFGEFAKVGAANYIEEVFSTYLYPGNSSTQTITNGIDLSTKGGLVWLKGRNTAGTEHELTDTARGTNSNGNALNSNDTQAAQFGDLTSFTSSGFGLSYNTANGNASGTNYVSWTFRKQPKFFDVVTWTGNNADGRFISHSLGSTPGMVIIKNLTSTYDWVVWHRSLANPSKYLVLNSTAATATDIYGPFGSYDGGFTTNAACFTSTGFYVAADARSNLNANNYVAYVFAHNAGGFGLTGTDNVISCGSFTTDGSGNATVNLGYEPQWVLMKSTATGAYDNDWYIIDSMRGQQQAPSSSDPYGLQNRLSPNTSGAESGAGSGYFTSTGFYYTNQSFSNTYIYIAIRRGPMKTPTTGTSVFEPVTTAAASAPFVRTNWPIDMAIRKYRPSTSANNVIDRMRGWAASTGYVLDTASTSAETSNFSSVWELDYSIGMAAAASTDTVYECFRRAPGFFDVVCYTGNNVYQQAQTHNLGVAPELIIVKRRNATANWAVGCNFTNTEFQYLNLNSGADGGNTNAYTTGGFFGGRPTATTFILAQNSITNASGGTYVAYLFATLAGVSKVGTYTGTGTTLQIDCGFTGGARFVLIKRLGTNTDAGTGDWYVWDSARGIVSGNDPYLLLNSTAAEVTNTDYIDTYSAGFEISSTAPAAINANGGSFIFLAIA